MKMQNHKRRKAGMLTIILTCVLMLLPLSAFAEENKDYSVPSADFMVGIGGNGDVQVTENWTVSYEKGVFSRFYKVIYGENLPREESFSLVEDSVRVAIDGRQAEWTDDTEGMPDDTYHVSKEGNSYSIYCYKTSEDITRHFEISYTLRDAVKIVDDEYDLFTFRLIGEGFDKRVDKVSVTIAAPEGSTIDIRNRKVFSGVIDGDDITKIAGHRDAGSVFKVKARIDGAEIRNAVPLTDADLSNNVNNDALTGESEGGGYLWWIAAGIFGLILLLVAVGVAEKKSAEKKLIEKVSLRLKEDPAYYSGLLSEWEDQLSPTELACGWASSGPENLVYSYLQYFMITGVVRIIDEENMEIVRRDSLTEEELKVLEFLDVAGDPEGVTDDLIQVEKLRNNIYTVTADLFGFEQELKDAVDQKVYEKLQDAENANKLTSAISELDDYCTFIKEEKRNAEELSGYTLLCMLVRSAKESDDPFTEVGQREERENDMVRFMIRYKLYRVMAQRYSIEHGRFGRAGGGGSGCSGCSACGGCGCGGS